MASDAVQARKDLLAARDLAQVLGSQRIDFRELVTNRFVRGGALSGEEGALRRQTLV